MAGVLGLSNVSEEDIDSRTGEKSILKTGNLKRSYNMPKGEKGQKLSYKSLSACKKSAKTAGDVKKCKSYFNQTNPKKKTGY